MLSLARNATLATIWILASTALYGADKPITVGLILDGLTQEEREPLRAYLTKAMGRPVNLAAPDSYADTVAGLADGTFDFACLGALMYIRAHAKYGVIPLVQRTSDLKFHSVFITGASSTIHRLGDLRGKQFAFGDINSASAHLIPYRELKEAGIDPKTDLIIRFSGSHPVTATLVETGVVEAGVLDESVFNSMISAGKVDSKKVRVFYISKSFVDYVYVAQKDVAEKEREQFVRALLALKEGKDDSILKVLRAHRFVIAHDDEYDNIRKIALELSMY